MNARQRQEPSAWRLELKAAARELIRDWPAVGLTLTAVALALLVAFLFFRPLFVQETEAKKYTHMHCAECDQEVPYNINMQWCPVCGPSGRMIPTVGSMFEGGVADDDISGARIAALAIISAVILLPLPFLWVWRLRIVRQRTRAMESRLLRCRCPFCKRKMGYPASRAGSIAACPRCKTSFPLPMDELEEAS